MSFLLEVGGIKFSKITHKNVVQLQSNEAISVVFSNRTLANFQGRTLTNFQGRTLKIVTFTMQQTTLQSKKFGIDAFEFIDV